MADASSSRQLFRKTALVFGYALVVSFGVAVMLIMESRPLDQRGGTIIALIGVGAFLAAAIVMFRANRFLRLSTLPRFIAIFCSVILLTFFIQGFLSGLLTIITIADHTPVDSFDGAADLSINYAYGFAYYVIYGSPLAWPVELAAALLFSLGFLTLRQQDDTNIPTRRTK